MLDRLRALLAGERSERAVDKAAGRAADRHAAVGLRRLVRPVLARLAPEVDAGVVEYRDGIAVIGVDHVRHDVGLGIAVENDAAPLVVADGVADDPGDRAALDVDAGPAIVADRVRRQRRYPGNPHPDIGEG